MVAKCESFLSDCAEVFKLTPIIENRDRKQSHGRAVKDYTCAEQRSQRESRLFCPGEPG